MDPLAKADKSEAVSLILCMSVMFWLIRWDKDSLGREARSVDGADTGTVDDAGEVRGKAEPIGASSAHQVSSSFPISVGTTVSEGNQAGGSSFLRFGSSGRAAVDEEPRRFRLESKDWPSERMARVLATALAVGRKPVYRAR